MVNVGIHSYFLGFLKRIGTALINRRVQAFLACILIGHGTAGFAGEDHDHDLPGKKAPAAGSPAPPPASAPKLGPRTSAPTAERPTEGCPVSPGSLAAFANGEAYEFSSMVTYLANPLCAANSRQLAQSAIREGISFNTSGPFRMDNFAASVTKGDADSLKRTDIVLGNSVPALLRMNPMTSQDLLPLLGQFAVLSPRAARSTLANIIQQELYSGDNLIQASPGSDVAARDLASTLMKLGAYEPSIASELAESIEDMALMSQADSLAQMFRALSAAATVEASLVPTFNLSASAINRGVQRGKNLFVASDKAAMTKTVFTGIQAALKGKDALEAGATELNEALAALLNGAPLQVTTLKKFWKEAVRILAATSTQTALAEAVAFSLNPQMIFLLPEDMGRLLTAAKNYPEIAGSIQANFLSAWKKLWVDLHDGKVKVLTFNRMKSKYFEPLVAEILELDPYLIDSFWLREVTRRGLVQDADVEKRFPRLVLAYLERRDKASRATASDGGLEPTMASMTENFAVLWSLSQVHVPALLKWVKKYEE